MEADRPSIIIVRKVKRMAISPDNFENWENSPNQFSITQELDAILLNAYTYAGKSYVIARINTLLQGMDSEDSQIGITVGGDPIGPGTV